MSVSVLDQRFVAAALRFSYWGMGLTSTNPSVSCLIVKDGMIVRRGVTALGGRPHAETQAIAEAGESAKAATAYVTLEPCSHYDTVPSCAHALIEANIARVVVCTSDPDIRVSGSGFLMLSEAGIIVDKGVLEKEARRVLIAYLTRQMMQRAYVMLKMAISEDNMIGLLNVGNVPITRGVSRAQSHLLTAHLDAILVGIGTVLMDDPELTCRLSGLESRSPVRIILDPHLELPCDAKLVRTASLAPVIVVTNCRTISASALERAGVEILYCDCHDIRKLLSILAGRGITSLLVEGGAAVARSFLASGFVDAITIYKSPKIIGKGGVLSPFTIDRIEENFDCIRRDCFGSEICLEYSRKV